ncbi:type II toxin-antitoxin system RelE/ParE family toxin [Sphingomonas sp. 2SG]|uniref:type II toxin-antitoxin system RelE/ParE family toxin n=1 Tax=Sphingomonas sp. 2SG TaxID=2502201 RepID=UPI0010F866B8|nr:type II toxin-antitoxin system RelE/ParE family toxin [Sphingomonas sp. 2SG]
MTLSVIWDPDARADLYEITSYIADRNPAAATRIGLALQHAADRLPDHPYIHRPGRIAGTREAIVHPNYILVYRVSIHAIEVLAVLHARQHYP